MNLGIISNYINNLAHSTGGGVGVITTIFLAVIQCFYGYRLFRYLVTFAGFVSFGALGYAIGVPISGGEQAVAVGIGIAVGLLGGFIAYKFYKVGVFIQCFTGGFIIGGLTGASLNWSRVQVGALAVVIGVLVGLIGVKLLKPVIVVCTGISGGVHIGVTLASLVGLVGIAGVFLGFVLAGCGIMYQINNLRGVSRKAKESGEEKELDMSASIRPPEFAIIPEEADGSSPEDSSKELLDSPLETPSDAKEEAGFDTGKAPAEKDGKEL